MISTHLAIISWSDWTCRFERKYSHSELVLKYESSLIDNYQINDVVFVYDLPLFVN